MLTAPTPTAPGGYLTTDDIARQLRRSAKSIRRFVATGMPAYKVRGRLFFDPAEVDAWMRARSAEPSAASDHRETIKRLVDAAPELTTEQAERIRTVLTGGAQ